MEHDFWRFTAIASFVAACLPPHDWFCYLLIFVCGVSIINWRCSRG